MSTRWYPIYQKGNPQLRVFLPNFWMKLISPEVNQPKNVVVFHCSMEMTRMDVRNYLQKIYNVTPVDVRTRIAFGPTKLVGLQKYVVKEEDAKVAYVVLDKDVKFTFPDLFKDSEEKKKEALLKKFEKNAEAKETPEGCPGMPTWF